MMPKVLFYTLAAMVLSLNLWAQDSLQPAVKTSPTLTVVGVGDMMLGTNFPNTGYLPPNDGKELLKPAHDVLQSADITFGNLEGTLLDTGMTDKCDKYDKCYAFRQPDHYVYNYVDAGFDMLSLANNHLNDFGTAGRENTICTLNEAGICAAGQEDVLEYDLFERNGMIIGFTAFAPNYHTLQITEYEKAKAIVAHLDTLADVVIVSFHGGGEGTDFQRMTFDTEYYYGENRGNVHEFAHTVVDAGADIVFGHGPHVVRAAELYNDRFIIYSLGNFCTYARFSLKGVKAYAPAVAIEVDDNGQFVSGKIHSFKQLPNGGPLPDPDHGAAKQIKMLSEADFPDGILHIQEDGTLLRR